MENRKEARAREKKKIEREEKRFLKKLMNEKKVFLVTLYGYDKQTEQLSYSFTGEIECNARSFSIEIIAMKQRIYDRRSKSVKPFRLHLHHYCQVT